MLAVISPAKSLDYESPLPTAKHSEPEHLDRAEQLVEIMAGKSPDELMELMSISPALAELNVERFSDWHRPFTPDNARPAVLAFTGDVYQGMEAGSFSERDFTHAQKVLRILSGLYGVLRPLDLMQPYRLEMGTRLANPAGRDLYDFWRPVVADELNAAIEASPGSDALINLASNEYFGAVDTERIAHRIVTPTFLDAKGSADFKVVSFSAKRARGAMVGWMIRERIRSPRALSEFDGLGYRYDPERSGPDTPVFTRRVG